MSLLFLYLAIALVFSFFCSISEAVLLSVRPAYVQSLSDKNPAAARQLNQLTRKMDRPLAAILSLNTIAHTVGAAGVGAQAARVFGDAWLGVTSGVLTFLILVFSEIIPKTLGATHWRRLAPPLAPVLTGLVRMLGPLVWMSDKITRLMSRKGSHKSVNREEFRAMAEVGFKEGGIDPTELSIVTNLLKLHGLSVRDIMTPRPVMFTVPHDMMVKDFFSKHKGKPFSRIPVYEREPDNITGYVLKNDLLTAQAEDRFDARLSEVRRDFPAIPDFSSASQVLDRLMQENSHAALVVDEYGSVQGLVTLEDVIETLIGLEIVDESDTIENMQALAHQQWRKRIGRLGIDPGTLEREKENPQKTSQ